MTITPGGIYGEAGQARGSYLGLPKGWGVATAAVVTVAAASTGDFRRFELGFYLIYGGLIALAAALVLIPGTPLGLPTSAVQSLAGVLPPSATVFLLPLCNDEAVLGPWVNGRWLNLFTGAVIAALVMLSVILTASVMWPDLDARVIEGVLAGGGVLTVVVWALVSFGRRGGNPTSVDRAFKLRWRMPPLEQLAPTRLRAAQRAWMLVLRAYLIVAGGLVLVRIVQLALGRG